VPLAVWITPADPTSPAEVSGRLVPVLLAQQLVAVYTWPGHTVHAAGHPASTHRIAQAATRLDRHLPATGDSGDRCLEGGLLDLLILTPPAGLGPAAWARRARLLTVTGIAAAVLPPDAAPGLPGQTIAAAETAGLGYLQHIIAIIRPPDDDWLLPEAPAVTGGSPDHLDVLVFAAPPTDQPTDTVSAVGGQAAGRDRKETDR
jgi:hypothetical protein